MDDDIQIEWNVDNEYSRDEAKEIKDQLKAQVKEQTGEEIRFYEAEELSVGAGTVAISYAIGIGSALTARAIYDALSDRDETSEINVDIDLEDVDDSEIEINIED